MSRSSSPTPSVSSNISEYIGSFPEKKSIVSNLINGLKKLTRKFKTVECETEVSFSSSNDITGGVEEEGFKPQLIYHGQKINLLEIIKDKEKIIEDKESTIKDLQGKLNQQQPKEASMVEYEVEIENQERKLRHIENFSNFLEIQVQEKTQEIENLTNKSNRQETTIMHLKERLKLISRQLDQGRAFKMDHQRQEDLISPDISKFSIGHRTEEEPKGVSQMEDSDWSRRPTDEVPNRNSQLTSEVTQILATVLNYIQEERRQDREEGKEGRRNWENWTCRDAVKASEKIMVKLKTQDLTQDEHEGFRHLNKWIQEVEKYCLGDSLRFQMFELTADKSLNRVMKLSKEKLQEISWEQLKALLMAQVPEMDPRVAVRQLMEHQLSENDSIIAFAANLQDEYEEVCRATGQKELKPGYSQILASAIVGKMNWKAQQMYRDDIVSDPENTIKEMAASFNKSQEFKRMLFQDSEDTSTTTGQNSSPTAVLPQVASSQLTDVKIPFTTTLSEKRREDFQRWKDWKCRVCRDQNPANWYTCNGTGCSGRATERQLPNNSWQCELTCGQNNWQHDVWCHCCMKANPAVSTDRLRPRPSTWVPQPRPLQK